MGAKIVGAAGLHVMDRDPVPMARCEHRELEGTAPGVWREDRKFEARTTRNVLGCIPPICDFHMIQSARGDICRPRSR